MSDQDHSTGEQLSKLIRSARRTMRKDKGLSTDLDRLPLLTWLMFLKFLDDHETAAEAGAAIGGMEFRPVVNAPYRWRDWAAPEDGLTGDELIEFVSSAEYELPDGNSTPGLLSYLRGLQASDDEFGRRSLAIATMFSDVELRLRSGYLLRDILNDIQGINFNSRDEIFTLGHIYESMLKEMRDAAGENGEFYTPRAVVRFMVKALDPRLGETVLDPASGTGGFLVEAFDHLRAQCQTVEDNRILQRQSVMGGEAKHLPYLLCQMNLLLHGLELPQIDPGNSLRFKLTEIGDGDRVDVVMTNPPFGGEEESGVLSNFPMRLRTQETALLFLQLILRKLKRGLPDGSAGGRAAVIVPNGILSGTGVAARVRELLVQEFNLEAIVRLPLGAFAPYTQIPTNILFFDTGARSETIWFYEVPPPDDQKTYTKKRQLTSQDLSGLYSWWDDKQESDWAWAIPKDKVSLTTDWNLDFKNPTMASWEALAEPTVLSGAISSEVARLADHVDDLRRLSDELEAEIAEAEYTLRPMHELFEQACREETVDAAREYPLLGVRLDGNGPYLRETKLGQELSAKKLYRVQEGDFIYSRLFAWRGAFGTVPAELNDCFVSNEFPVFVPKSPDLDPRVLALWFRLPGTLAIVEADCTGSTPVTRNRYKTKYFLSLSVPVPSKELQNRLLKIVHELDATTAALGSFGRSLQRVRKSSLGHAFPSTLEER